MGRLESEGNCNDDFTFVESNNPNPFWDLGISHTKCTRPEDFYDEVNLTFNVRKISVRAHLQT